MTIAARSSEQLSVSLGGGRGLGARGKGDYAALVVMGVGVALRVVRYVHDHSMWLDESMLSLNVVGQGWGHLLGALDYNQAAPVGFLLMEKGAAGVLGVSELALRLPALVFGVAALPVGWWLFRRALGRRGALFALALLALAEEPIRYVSEVKQYSSDLFVTLLLLWLAVRFVQTGRGLWVLAAAGAVGLWVSHAAVFIAAGIGVVLAYRAVEALRMRGGAGEEGAGESRAPVAGLCVLGVLWLGSFAAEYVVTLRGIGESAYLKEYWAGAFPPMPVSGEGLRWYYETVVRMPLDALSFAGMPGWLVVGYKVVAVLAMSLAIDGFLLMRRRAGRGGGGERALAGMIGAAVVFLFAAGALHEYPLQGRLLLFAMPLWVVLAGASVENFFAARKSAVAIGGRVVSGLIVAGAAVAAGWTAVRPPGDPDNREMAAYVAAHAEPGDVLLALGSSYYPVRYYAATGYPALAGHVILQQHGDPWRAEWKEFDEGAAYVGTHHGRVWVMFSELGAESAALVGQRDLAVGTFLRVGRRLDQRVGGGTEVDLFDVR